MSSAESSAPRLLPSSLLAVGAVLLFTGERIIGEGKWHVALSSLGAACIVGALLLRVLRLGSASVAHVKTCERYLLLASAGVAVSFVIYAASTEALLSKLHLSRTALERCEGSLGVLWVALFVVSAFALLFMERAYGRMPVEAAVEVRRLTRAGQAGLTTGLALVFLASINYVVTQRDTKKDLSYFKTTLPSETSRSIVSRLGEKVRIVLFYPEVSEVLAQVRPFFKELAKRSPKVTLEIKDSALAPELAREYRIRSNGYVLLLKGDGPRPQGESFEIGQDLEESRGRLKKLDATFQETFTKLTQPARSVHFTVGHREHTAVGEEGDEVGDRISAVRDLLRRSNITTSELGIAQGLASKVPDDARAVALIGPRDKFLPEESQALLQFVRGGGRLLLALDPDLDLGLEPLLTGLGVELQAGTLTAEKRHMRRSFTEADRTIIYANSFTSQPVVTSASRNASQVASVFIGGGSFTTKPAPAGAPESKFNPALYSFDDVWHDLNHNFQKDDGEPSGRGTLIATVTLGQGDKEGRVVLIGDGDFVSDQVINNAGNALVFIDSLRWLIGEEKIVGGLSSEEDVQLQPTRDRDKIWFYAVTFGVPVPVLLGGLWISRRRKRRSERVEKR